MKKNRRQLKSGAPLNAVKTKASNFNGSFILLFYSAVFISMFFSQKAQANTGSPTIRLFPSSVVEEIKQTGETARDMENGLHGVINTMETQLELFKNSKCDGNDMGEGCQKINDQLADSFEKLMDQLESGFPKIESAAMSTKKNLEKRIRHELGKKTTPRGLQKLLEGSVQNKSRARRSGSGRLSEKFRQYYNLVRMSNSSAPGNSLAVVASEIYLDTSEVIELIALTRDEIARAKLANEIRGSYSTLTPEMSTVVSNVKKIIFGETEEPYGVPDAPEDSSEETYRSPLKF